MKALLCTHYGTPDDLVIADLPDPVAGEGEVVVRVHAVGLNFFDTLIIAGKYQVKPAFPFSPGAECAGVVESVGAGVTRLSVGDRVVAYCRHGAARERIAVPEARVTRVPDGLDDDHAAGLCVTYGTSYHALKDRGDLKPGETLAVLGASGGVGLAAVELGKLMGARVVACVSSAEKLAFAKKHGADAGIDYSREDFTRTDRRYDLIIGANAYRPISDYARALEPNGTYVMSGGGGTQILQAMFQGLWLSMTSSKKLGNIMATAKKADLLVVKELLETGKIAPVIERNAHQFRDHIRGHLARHFAHEIAFALFDHLIHDLPRQRVHARNALAGGGHREFVADQLAIGGVLRRVHHQHHLVAAKAECLLGRRVLDHDGGFGGEVLKVAVHRIDIVIPRDGPETGTIWFFVPIGRRVLAQPFVLVQRVTGGKACRAQKVDVHVRFPNSFRQD